MAKPPTARETRAAYKDADIVLQCLSRAGDAAIQTTLNAICDKLKANVPLMYHISALLHNDGWVGALEATIAGGGGDCSGEKFETKKSWKLRSVVNKFYQLETRVGQVMSTM